jgi:hypothetical protein
VQLALKISLNQLRKKDVLAQSMKKERCSLNLAQSMSSLNQIRKKDVLAQSIKKERCSRSIN